MAKQNMTKVQVQHLRTLLEQTDHDLKLYLEGDTELCGIRPEDRQASIPYLNSWVAGPLSQALKILDRVQGRELTDDDTDA